MTDDPIRPYGDARAPSPTPPSDNQHEEHGGPPKAVGQTDTPQVRQRRSPLHPHSLRGDGIRLKARAIDTKPLLGDFLMHGQATMIYAKPNAGKTLTVLRLVLDAIQDGRVEADVVIYINADDSGKGLADKVELTEAVGAHMLAPGYKGFKASEFAEKLSQAARNGSARGLVVIIDTLKKFVGMMDKQWTSEFAQVCREFVMAGGTVIALGHTAKNPNPDGTPRYQGTTDILEDFDAVYVAEAINGPAGSNERIIRFTQQKARADSPEVVGYAYSVEQGLSYEAKLESVRSVYPEELDGSDFGAEVADEELIAEHIRGYLACGHGHVGLDHMVRVIARGEKFSRVQVRRVLDRFTGAEPSRHRWNFIKGDRGKRTYFLLPPQPDESVDPEDAPSFRISPVSSPRAEASESGQSEDLGF